ncbi:MAG: hypothetical protein HYY06_20330 [Deltaproteobacteria bacterium]|nr:hypothetical protein [Deltaproteobacteria bacterium]
MSNRLVTLTLLLALGVSACRDIIANPEFDAPDSARDCLAGGDGGAACPAEAPVCDEITGSCCTVTCRPSGAFCGENQRCRVCSTHEECSAAGLGETCADGGACE